MKIDRTRMGNTPFNVHVAAACLVTLYVLTAILCIVASLCVQAQRKTLQTFNPKSTPETLQTLVPKNNQARAKNTPETLHKPTPDNPYNRPGGNSDPPNNYWEAKPYGVCVWVPGTNCPENQVFAGITKDDCNAGDAKTLCANQWWENLSEHTEFEQSNCSIGDVICSEDKTWISSSECPLTIDSEGKTVAHGNMSVCKTWTTTRQGRVDTCRLKLFCESHESQSRAPTLKNTLATMTSGK